MNPLRVVSATFFSPRGGSAYVARALARCLRADGVEITHVAGSRSDLEGDAGDARAFYGDVDVRAVDFAPALASADPMMFTGGAPMHPSFEDRPGRPTASSPRSTTSPPGARWPRGHGRWRRRGPRTPTSSTSITSRR